MTLRTILVHLDGGERAGLRLALAAGLASAHGARLTGVFAQIAQAHQVGLVAEWPPQEYAEAAEASRAAFNAATQELQAKGLKTQWIDLNRGAESDIISQMLDLSRHFDLIVLGQRHNGDNLFPPELAERLIIDGGRPVLVIPTAGEFPSVGKRPIFTWTDSGSAARGFSDGIMLAAKDADALVVALARPNEPDSISYQKVSLQLAVEHLAAHDVTARSEQLVLSEIGLMDALLNRAADHGADLLSLGAFGGGGYPLFSRGSGSRYMLKHITLPTLFSH